MDNYFGCGKSGHKVKDCANLKGKDKGSGKAQDTGSNVDSQRRITFMHLAQGVNKRVLLMW